MREIIKLVMSLVIICAVCSALLALVWLGTSDQRQKAQDEKKVNAASSVLPEGASAPEIVVAGGVTNFASYDEKSGKIIATAIECSSPNGYSGIIRLMVGISAEGKVVDYVVLEAKETPGLGAKISFDSFVSQFRQRAIDSTKWLVKKDGGDIDAITAATISSRAVCEAISSAIEMHKSIIAECGTKAGVK